MIVSRLAVVLFNVVNASIESRRGELVGLLVKEVPKPLTVHLNRTIASVGKVPASVAGLNLATDDPVQSV